jgi:internalin A
MDMFDHINEWHERQLERLERTDTQRIEEEIREVIGKPEGELAEADLQKVTKLLIENQQLTDITALAGLTKLTKLSLHQNELTDDQLKYLEGFVKLKVLELGDNKFADVRALAGLTKLKELYLRDNQLTDVSPLAGLTKLTMLGLGDNQLTDISPLAGLTKLKKLDLGNNQLSDVSALARLSKLAVLYLRDNADLTKAEITKLQDALPHCIIWHGYLTNAERIETRIREEIGKPTGKLTKADLKMVVELCLDDNRLTEISTLPQLPQLKELYLRGNQLPNNQLKHLEEFTQLKRLYLSFNKLSKGEIDRLQEMLPRCRISHNSRLSAKESAAFIDAVVRKQLEKPTGELTESDLGKVKKLKLGGSDLTDISALAGLTKLNNLQLHGNRIRDLSVLTELKKLKFLYLSHNKLTDEQLGPLAELVQLKRLYLVGNQLTNLSALSGLSKLVTLELYNNDLIEAEIERLQMALPNCEIEHNAIK